MLRVGIRLYSAQRLDALLNPQKHERDITMYFLLYLTVDNAAFSPTLFVVTRKKKKKKRSPLCSPPISDRLEIFFLM